MYALGLCTELMVFVYLGIYWEHNKSQTLFKVLKRSNGEGRRSRSVSALEFGFPWWANSQQANKYNFQMMTHIMKKLNQNSRIKYWHWHSERKSSSRCQSSPSDSTALGTLMDLWAKVRNCTHTMRHLWSSLTSSSTFSDHKTFAIVAWSCSSSLSLSQQSRLDWQNHSLQACPDLWSACLFSLITLMPLISDCT